MRLNFTRAMCLVFLLLPLCLKAQVQIGYSEVLRPVDYATDGNLHYVLTEYNIQVFSKTGTLVRKIAVPGTHSSPPRATGFAIADNMIFIADGQNRKVLILTMEGVLFQEWRTAPGAPGEFLPLNDIAVKDDGAIYTTEGFYIRSYTHLGALLGSFGSSGMENGQFRDAYKLTFDNQQNIYVTDRHLQRIQKFGPTGNFLMSFGPQNSFSSSQRGIAFDGNGNIFTSDSELNEVHQYTVNGTFVKKIAASAVSNIAAANQQIISMENLDRVVFYNTDGQILLKIGGRSSEDGKLSYPAGVGCDTQGNIYVADRDNYRIQVFDNKGNFTRKFGSYGFENSQFQDIKGLAVGKDGKIYVVDYRSIKVFNNNGTHVKTYNYTGSGSGGVRYPKALALDKDDNLYVADTPEGRVVVFDKNLQYIRSQSVASAPYSVAVDDNLNIYVGVAGQGIHVYDKLGNLRIIAGNGDPHMVQLSSAIAVKGDLVYVTSLYGVSVYTKAGVFVSLNSNFGDEPGQFVPDQERQSGMAINHKDEMVVADRLRVQILSNLNKITFDPLSAKTYGDAPFDITATSTSGLAVTFESSDPSTASISGKRISIHKAGSVTITAKQPGDGGEIPPAASVSQTLKINKADQVVTFKPFAPKRWGDEDFVAEVSSPSGGFIMWSTSNNNIASVNSGVISIHEPGTAFITAFVHDTNNYNGAAATQLLTVEKAQQAINFAPIPPKEMRDVEFLLPEFAHSGLRIEYFSSNPGVLSISGNIAKILAPGIVTITARQDGDMHWEAAFAEQQTVTITADSKHEQQIEFPAIPAKRFGDQPFTLAAIASSDLTVTFRSSNESVLKIVNNTVTILKAGVCEITASQDGNDDYYPAPDVTQTINIDKGIQEIEFEIIPEQIFKEGRVFNVEATGNSDLPVTFSIEDESVASVEGNVVTLISPGTTTITASAPEDERYIEAHATQTLVVKLITGLEDVNSDLVAYPNPAKDFVYVVATAQPFVINTLGQMFFVPVESIKTDLHKVNISSLKPGIYILKSNNKSFKIIKE